MKLLSILISTLILNVSSANVTTSCQQPKGIYTDLEMVLNQFVLNNGNPNWGDWCFEIDPKESKVCNSELDQWDSWLVCSNEYFKNHCHEYAVKENFLTSLFGSQYNDFIEKCVLDNYRSLL